MRKLIFLVLALFAMVFPAFAGTVTLQWGAVSGADGYYVYTDGSKGPVNNGTTATVTVPAGAHSFYVTAFNGWGESGPSNTVTTPPLMTAPTNVRVTVFVDVQTGAGQ